MAVNLFKGTIKEMIENHKRKQQAGMSKAFVKTGKPMYEGLTDAGTAKLEKRRARNKRAKATRKRNRKH